MFRYRKLMLTLCRLLLAVWVFAFAFGSIEGCFVHPDYSSGRLATAVLTSMSKAGHGHDAGVEVCEKYCQNVSTSLAKADQSNTDHFSSVFTLLLWMILLLPLLSRLSENRSGRGRRSVAPAAPYPPFVLFQRFNN